MLNAIISDFDSDSLDSIFVGDDVTIGCSFRSQNLSIGLPVRTHLIDLNVDDFIALILQTSKNRIQFGSRHVHVEFSASTNIQVTTRSNLIFQKIAS